MKKREHTKKDSSELRQKAEASFTEKIAKKTATLTDAETLKLFHELEVHRIELEMQNDELLKVKSALESALEKYSNLYEFAPLGYFTLTKKGIITQINLKGTQMLGKERSLIINSSFGFFVSDGSKKDFNQFLENIFQQDAEEICDLKLVAPPDKSLYVHLTGIPGEKSEHCHVIMVDISGRVLAEQALMESEELYRITMENILDPLFVTDFEGRFRYICPGAVAGLGFTVEEIRHAGNIFNFMGGQIFDMDELKEKGQIVNLEHSFYDKSGEQHHFLITINKVSVQGGSILFVFHDVTEKYRAQRLQRAHIKLLDFSANHSVDELLQAFLDEAEALTDSEIGFYHFVEADQKTISLQSWSSKTRCGICKVIDADHRKYPIEEAGIWVECIAQKKPVIHNDYATAKGKKGLPEGHVHVVRQLVVPVIRSGKILAVLGVGNKQRDYNKADIDAIQRLADLGWETVKGKQAEASLKESERQARALINAIPDLILRISKHGILLGFEAPDDPNCKFVRPEIGKSCLDILPQGIGLLTLEKVKLTLETGKMQIYEFRVNNPDKGFCDFDARMVPYDRRNVILIIRNVTREKKAAEELLVKNKQLLAANAEKDKFFSIIAHDLKSPFNVFLGATELIQNEYDELTEEQIKSLIGSLHGSAKKLYTLLEHLLEWSKMQRGTIPFEPKPIKLDALAEESLGLIKEMADQKDIDLQLKIPDDMVVMADHKMLESLLRNLAGNAIKFTKPGGKIQIMAKMEKKGHIHISVRDSGIGIPEEDLKNLFSLTDTNNRPGTQGEPSSGLGLLLCNEYAQKHGGKIHVFSEEGNGSTFTVVMPNNLPVH